MRKLLCLLSVCAFASVNAQVNQPDVMDATDYTGESFCANWLKVSGAEGYLLNVYSAKSDEEVSASVNLMNSTPSELVDMQGTYDENEGTWCLTEDGQSVTLTLPEGQFSQLILYAVQFDNDNVTVDNTTNFRIELFNTAGERIIYGDGNGNYFSGKPSLDLFEAFGMVVPEINSVRVTLLADETHKVGKLALRGIEYAYYAPHYVVENQQVTDTEYQLTGLDPELTYFYNVRAYKGEEVSHKSADKCVDNFLDPTTQEAANLRTTSYTARWNHTPKAWDYVVQNYRVNKLEAGTEAEVFHDTFAGAKEGTIEAPVSVTSLDEYTDQKGWIGSKMAIAEGMIGTTAGNKSQGYRGYNYLQTPLLDLTASQGVYTISLKAHTNGEAETLSIYNTINIITDETGKQSLNIHTVDVPESGYVEATWTMDDGMSGMRLSIEPKNLKSFFIDELTITQALDEDKEVLELQEEKSTEETEVNFDGLTAGATYAYIVRAHRYDFYGYEQNSANSETRYLTLPTTEDGVSAISAERDDKCYDLQGRKVSPSRHALYIINGKKVIK